MNLTRGQKLFYTACLVVVFCAYGIVGNYDYEDEIKYEKYIAELNARKLLDREFPEEFRPAMIASPEFVGSPSKRFYEREYAQLQAKYEEKRRRRWESKE